MATLDAKMTYPAVGCFFALLFVSYGLLATDKRPANAADQRVLMVVQADIQQITIALTLYEGTSGSAPTTDQGLDALLKKPVKEPIPARWSRWLDELPLDPWKHSYHYRFPATKSKKHFDIWSAGPDGIDNTADDIGNW